MSSILKWIWSAVRWVGKKVVSVLEALWNVLSSALTWVIASITYILETIWNWISTKLSAFLDSVSGMFPNVPDFDLSNGNHLFGHLFDVFALDDALYYLAFCAAVFVGARLLRLTMVPVRALLEVL